MNFNEFSEYLDKNFVFKVNNKRINIKALFIGLRYHTSLWETHNVIWNYLKNEKILAALTVKHAKHHRPNSKWESYMITMYYVYPTRCPLGYLKANHLDLTPAFSLLHTPYVIVLIITWIHPPSKYKS